MIFISFLNTSFSYATKCNKYDKLSKEYAKCTSNQLKDKTSKQANKLKAITSEKINLGKEKLKKLNLKDKLKKFKSSKSHKEFSKK